MTLYHHQTKHMEFVDSKLVSLPSAEQCTGIERAFHQSKLFTLD